MFLYVTLYTFNTRKFGIYLQKERVLKPADKVNIFKMAQVIFLLGGGLYCTEKRKLNGLSSKLIPEKLELRIQGRTLATHEFS